MKNPILKKFCLFLIFVFITVLGNSAYAFEWLERGITVKSTDTTEEGTREFLETQQLKSFVVIYGKGLLTDPVKEKILALRKQIEDTYNLPTSSIEFKIKPSIFQINLVLQQTGQIVGITNHGLSPSDSVIPTISSMVNEFAAWKNLTISNFQFVIKPDGFQTVVAPETSVPIINLNFSSSLPQKKIVSNLAGFYNQISNQDSIKPQAITFEVGVGKIDAIIDVDGGRLFEISYAKSSFDENDLNRITQTISTISSWKSLNYRDVRINAKSQNIDTLVVLKSAQFKGNNILKHLPAGIRLSYDNEIEYNFRVISGTYYVEVKGDYSDETRLLWRINEAIQNPILYIQKYDPEFFFRQLSSIRDRNAEIYNELKNKQTSSYEELKAKHERLKSAHERFIYGFITMENSGFMGTADIDKNAISRIVELKTENADLNRDQLETQLKQENFDVSDKVIDLVLNLYFNDFK